MACYSSGGIDDSLLFFFLILILMLCNPSVFGCGSDPSAGCTCGC